MKRIFSMACAVALGASAFANTFNEFFINPAGADDTAEFFELKGTPNTSTAGLTLVVIEGDGAAAGTIDQAIPLTASYGSNGLLLLRDNVLVLSPAPDPATTLVIGDFAPDIENGTNTYLIVSGFTGTVGQDLDAENDGTLESTPWTSVSDAVSYTDLPVAADFGYAAQLGGTHFVGNTFTPEAYCVFGGIETIIDTAGAIPGPFTVFGTNMVDPTGAPVTFPGTFTLTPGSANPVNSAAFHPSSFSIVLGTPFGGNVASLGASDDDKVYILNDESDSTAIIECTATGVTAPTSSLTIKIETSATRNDLTEFYRALSYVTNGYFNVGSGTSSLTDVVRTITPGGNPGDYVSGTGEAKMRIQWIPQADLEAADGWSEAVDIVEWNVL